jgi:hypothetical protein
MSRTGDFTKEHGTAQVSELIKKLVQAKYDICGPGSIQEEVGATTVCNVIGSSLCPLPPPSQKHRDCDDFTRCGPQESYCDTAENTVDHAMASLARIQAHVATVILIALASCYQTGRPMCMFAVHWNTG